MVKRSKNKIKLMLDSGAFSVWNRGEGEINIRDYIDYVKRNEKYLESYVNLDVIPGVFGRRRSTDEVEASAQGSYENLQIMKAEGLRPIPVFHQHERVYWLEKMLEDGEDYIGITLDKENRPDAGRGWLDEMFSLLTDSQGRPLVKVHGFGITKPSLLLRYPWYTVDSTTWALSPAYGKMFVPIYVDGVADYTKIPVGVQISGVVVKSGQKRQFEALGPAMQECITRFLEEEVGLTVAQTRYDLDSARRRAMLTYFVKMCEQVRDVRYDGPRMDLTRSDELSVKGLKAQKPFNLSIMYATRLNNKQSYALNVAEANTRLLSYFELRNHPDKILRRYVKTGYHTTEEYRPRDPLVEWSEEHLNYRRGKLIERLQEYEEIAREEQAD